MGGGMGGAGMGAPPPSNRFGPPAKPGGGKADFAQRRKKTEGGEGGQGRNPRGAKRANEDRWRDEDDDE